MNSRFCVRKFKIWWFINYSIDQSHQLYHLYRSHAYFRSLINYFDIILNHNHSLLHIREIKKLSNYRIGLENGVSFEQWTHHVSRFHGCAIEIAASIMYSRGGILQSVTRVYEVKDWLIDQGNFILEQERATPRSSRSYDLSPLLCQSKA